MNLQELKNLDAEIEREAVEKKQSFPQAFSVWRKRNDFDQHGDISLFMTILHILEKFRTVSEKEFRQALEKTKEINKGYQEKMICDWKLTQT